MRRWILLAFAVTVVWGCPKDVMIGVRECMGPLEIYSVERGGILELMSRIEKTTQLCTDGKIQMAFSCLSELYNRCARPKTSTRRLELLVDVGKWSQAMNTICSNIQYFRENAECERKASLEYMPCAETELEKAASKLSSLWMNDQEDVNEDEKINAVLRMACVFSTKILDCLRKPFDKFCPKQMTNLLVSTFENFMPPACARRTTTNSSKDSPYHSYNGEYSDVVIGTPKSPHHKNRNTESVDKTRSHKSKGKDGSPGAIESSRQRSISDGNTGSSKFKSFTLLDAFMGLVFVSVFYRM